jgi:hypothetical protein
VEASGRRRDNGSVGLALLRTISVLLSNTKSLATPSGSMLFHKSARFSEILRLAYHLLGSTEGTWSIEELNEGKAVLLVD